VRIKFVNCYVHCTVGGKGLPGLGKTGKDNTKHEYQLPMTGRLFGHRVLLEQVLVPYLVNVFFAHCGTQTFILSRSQRRALTLSQMNPIQSHPPSIPVTILPLHLHIHPRSRRFITVFTTTTYLPPSWARSIQSMTSQPTSLRSILILCSHYAWVFQVVSLPQISPQKPCMPISLVLIWSPEWYLVRSAVLRYGWCKNFAPKRI
jgi:hypothetical protein